MGRRYEKGRRFEYRVKRELERQGYVVFRCAGSKPVDLIAMKRGGPNLIVECKLNGKFSRDDLWKLFFLAEDAGAVPMIAWKEGRLIRLKRLDISEDVERIKRTRGDSSRQDQSRID